MVAVESCEIKVDPSDFIVIVVIVLISEHLLLSRKIQFTKSVLFRKEGYIAWNKFLKNYVFVEIYAAKTSFKGREKPILFCQ
jgi:hypothetical protein